MSQNNKLLFVFLRGGYDCANLLVPIDSSFYYEQRPNIAIPKPTGNGNSALALDAHWGLHPALTQSLWPLYQQKELCFLPFVGSDDVSRSHFATQDTLEMGISAHAPSNLQSGFLNRLATELDHSLARPIAFTPQMPIIFRGTLQVPNMPLSQLGKSQLDERQASIVATMYANTALSELVRESFEVRSDIMQTMQDEMNAANRDAMNIKGFEAVARRMAKLMQTRFDIGFVDVGGWDTHIGQGATTGKLANLLEELGRGLAAFSQEMRSAQAWQRTTVIVMSEFGRTLRENGNRGTDHGHGSVMWVLGGSVAGGRVLGEQVSVESRNLFENRDYPVLNDYRAVLGGLFQRMYSLNSNSLQKVFANVAPRDFGVL